MPEMDEQAIDTPLTSDTKTIIKAALEKIAAKAPRVARYDRYYKGFHPLNFGSEKFTTEFAERLQKFRDNLCPTVVQAPADRLEVTGFSSDKNSALYKSTWDIWKYSQMPRIAKRVHRDAFRTGDAFVVVWADAEGRARIYHQDPKNCTVFYDMETGNVDIGAKVWQGTDKFVYLTIYYRDRIEKYKSNRPQSGGSVPSTAAGFERRIIAGEPWPLPNAIDVNPMFHFGRETSILDDVIPLNDALNKSICDLLISSEGNSLLKRWATGISYEINPETGKQIIPFDNFATWFAVKEPEGKFGSFPEIDLTKFVEIIKDFRGEIAAVSGIPLYFFTQESVNLPSGEALRKLESRFTALVKDAQLDFGETWAAAMKFAVAVEDKATTEDTSAGSSIETAWTAADALSTPEAVALGIQKKQIGVSTKQVLSEVGYTDAQITEMDKDNQAAATQQATNFSKVFDAGPSLAGGSNLPN
jgi:hypothetical protein